VGSVINVLSIASTSTVALSTRTTTLANLLLSGLFPSRLGSNRSFAVTALSRPLVMRMRANTAFSYIARLSQIETQLREAYPRTNLQGLRDFDAVAAARQQHSLPILNQFKASMDDEMKTGRMLPKSEIRKAFTYTLNQWSALCRYTEGGYFLIAG
jgi:hypothetical protein